MTGKIDTARAPLFLAAAALLASLAIPMFLSGYLVFQATMFLVYIAALLGLNILVGFNGQISLGHGAFFALGAYVAAISGEHFNIPYWLWPVISAVLCYLFGLLLGFPALRLGGIYLALATFGLALAVPQLLKNKAIEAWTGGVQGVVVLKPDSPIQSFLGFQLDADRWLYLFTWVIVVLMYIVARNFLRGRIGRALIAVRDHPVAASTMAVNVPMVKTMAFGLSAAYAGIAGSLAALAVGFVAPDSFPSFLSITLLVGVVVGGLGRLSGAIYGALFVLLVPNLAEQVSKSAPAAIYGVLLILILLVMPTGVAGALRNLLASLRARPSRPQERSATSTRSPLAPSRSTNQETV